ncbi:DUF4199 family protein [Pedobacter sp. HMF7647]|uniref:DUF4199 family protein n=1 Tax=Hufsiella arboris TaxID=2695275 RepID=A0A7K1Y6J1_9SPHI|nr:DUF4199 domain-containing protein [Hufsiella arboris]MXV50196.1 DUF4199 family protein [Hufsiella arboris]
MKKIVIVFGLISGLIVSAMVIYSTTMCYLQGNFEGSMLLGYASMILAFSLIFVAVKNYRDKYNSGVISFGKAFRIGLYITLISSTVYVLVWMVDYYVFIPDFMERYTSHVLNEARAKGATSAELAAKTAELKQYSEMYKSPLGVMLMTYLEIFPVGLIVSVICALILKRKNHSATTAVPV